MNFLFSYIYDVNQKTISLNSSCTFFMIAYIGSGCNNAIYIYIYSYVKQYVYIEISKKIAIILFCLKLHPHVKILGTSDEFFISYIYRNFKLLFSKT